MVGSWFDLITISLFFFPYILLCTVPVSGIFNKYRQILASIVYVPSVVIVFFFNTWDIAYFSFTRKRISYDYFKFIVSENEASMLAGDFIAEFWWLVIIFLFMVSSLFVLHFKLKKSEDNIKSWQSWLKFLTAVCLFVVIGRGGFQLRPVGVLEATNYCSLENAPAVLNSAFTVLKTYTNEGVEGKRYFSKSELNSIFNPIQESNPQNLLSDNTNVVFILFESFGSMYVGPRNKESYTPFLDSY